MCGHVVDPREGQCENCGETLLGSAEGSSEHVPTAVLHPCRGAFWAGILGSPIATGLILAINYWRLRQKGAACCIFSIGVFAVVVIATLDEFIPKVSDGSLWFMQLAALIVLATFVQSARIREHIRRGGVMASAWKSAGIGLLCGITFWSLAVALPYAVGPSEVQSVRSGNDEVYYSGDASGADAHRLARVLRIEEYFTDEEHSVWLELADGRYTVSFLVNESDVNNLGVDEYFQQLGQRLIVSAFSPPIDIRLCTGEWSSRKTMTIR